MSSFFPSELIKTKRRGKAHTKEELEFLIQSYTKGEIPDYQMSAWLMAVFFQGMTSEETSLLTEQMLLSGQCLDFSDLKGPAVDKHSTGGVGDKTSLILAPLVGAAGIPVPMIAGRGLGHTGGTLDKLEAIPGFSVDISLQEFSQQVRTFGAAIIGQTAEICPADKKIYALRDVTATVESLPLICASIMSKKLAEGLGALVLDVKFGSGAFMKTLADAEELAGGLIQIGRHRGVKVRALLTNMNQPLGRFVGNALEVEECLQIMKQESSDECPLSSLEDCQELTLRLAGEMICLGGKATSPEEGYKRAKDILLSGKAYDSFKAMVHRQGGRLDQLPKAPHRRTWNAPQAGFLASVDVEKMGLAAIELGAGRLKVTDPIDPVAGLFVHCKPGDRVEAGDPIVTMYASQESRFESAEKTLAASHEFSLNKVPQAELIQRVMGDI